MFVKMMYVCSAFVYVSAHIAWTEVHLINYLEEVTDLSPWYVMLFMATECLQVSFS